MSTSEEKPLLVMLDNLEAEFCALRAGVRDALIREAQTFGQTACIVIEGKNGYSRAFVYNPDQPNDGWFYLEGPNRRITEFTDQNRETGSTDRVCKKGDLI